MCSTSNRGSCERAGLLNADEADRDVLLDLGKGAYVVLGFIPEGTHITPHVSFDPNSKEQPNLDWMFED